VRKEINQEIKDWDEADGTKESRSSFQRENETSKGALLKQDDVHAGGRARTTTAEQRMRRGRWG